MTSLLGRWIAGIAVVFLFSGCDKQEKESRYMPTGSNKFEHYYTVGIHHYLNSTKMFTAYRPIFDLIESKIPLVHFKIETSKDYSAFDEKLYAGTFDFALPNPYQTYKSFNHGYYAIAKMKPDSIFRGIFVTRIENNITNVQDLKGKKISFPAPTALAATMMPLYYLFEQGLNVEKDIFPNYVGSQYSSIMNAYSKDTFVAATWPPPWEQWKKENPEKAKEMKLVWQTKPLVNNGFVARHDVPDPIVQKVSQALIELDQTPQGKQALENAGFDGFEKANNAVYDVVSTFLEKYQQAFGTQP